MPSIKSPPTIDPTERPQRELQLARQQLGPEQDPFTRRGLGFGKEHIRVLASSGTAEDLALLYEVADRARGNKMDHITVIEAAALALANLETPQADLHVSKLLERTHTWHGAQHALLGQLTIRSKRSDNSSHTLLKDAYPKANWPIRMKLIEYAVYHDSKPVTFLKKGLQDTSLEVASRTLELIETEGLLEPKANLQVEYLRIASGNRKVLGVVRERVINQLAEIARHPDVTGVLRQLARSGEPPYRQKAAEILQNEGLLEETT